MCNKKLVPVSAAKKYTNGVVHTRRFRFPVCATWFFDELQLFDGRPIDSKCVPMWRQQTGSGRLNQFLVCGSTQTVVIRRETTTATLGIISENYF